MAESESGTDSAGQSGRERSKRAGRKERGCGGASAKIAEMSGIQHREGGSSSRDRRGRAEHGRRAGKDGAHARVGAKAGEERTRVAREAAQ